MSQRSQRGISNVEYVQAEEDLFRHYKDNKIFPDELLEQMNLFVTAQHKRREIFLYEIYKLLIDKPGAIAQFGVRWGREIALFEMYRTIFEPFNHSRMIYGFDTFSGYPTISETEQNELLKMGGLGLSKGYFDYLLKVLRTREKLNPLPQIEKFELIRGRVEDTLPKFLNDKQHQLFVLVHLDLNLGDATRFVLKHIKKHLFKGSIIVVDETCHPKMAGETLAVLEEFSGHKIALKRFPSINTTWQSYFVVE